MSSKTAVQMALETLIHFNETGGTNCKGFCFYVHDASKPVLIMGSWAPPGEPIFGLTLEALKRYETREVPEIKVVGLSYVRDYKKVYRRYGELLDIIPLQTHHVLELESSLGRFNAEVSQKDWEEKVLPAWRAAVSEEPPKNQQAVFSDPFDEWWANGGGITTTSDVREMMRKAYEAGRRSVGGTE